MKERLNEAEQKKMKNIASFGSRICIIPTKIWKVVSEDICIQPLNYAKQKACLHSCRQAFGNTGKNKLNLPDQILR
jgi:hypothetical protein